MSAPDGYVLAELNVGHLTGLPDDPLVTEFMENLDKINRLGKRMRGFVWMMEGSGAPGKGNTENSIGEDPQYVVNLTLWQDVETLGNSVWKTVHKQFYDRRHEWFQVLKDMQFVMWWVPAGHRPSLGEALERLEYLRANGDSNPAFGWGWLTEGQSWAAHQCEKSAAE
jgi:hypothetical protein